MRGRSVFGGALVALLVLGLAAPATAKKHPKPSLELGACRVLAASYDPATATNQTLATRLASDALDRFKRSKVAEIRDILSPLRLGEPVPDLGPRLGAFCLARYPRDVTVSTASFPTTTTTSSTTTSIETTTTSTTQRMCYIDPEGNCYRPGQFCPKALRGQTVQGESGPIACVYNNGWRWEPA